MANVQLISAVGRSAEVARAPSGWVTDAAGCGVARVRSRSSAASVKPASSTGSARGSQAGGGTSSPVTSPSPDMDAWVVPWGSGPLSTYTTALILSRSRNAAALTGMPP